LAIVAFEIDMQFVSGWRERAMPSRFYGSSGHPGQLFTALWIHLFFAVPTAVLWLVVITQAVRKFPSPPMPAEHSRFHLLWAKVAAIGMFATAVTGWIFYYLAFIA
jgi:putative membrane protein